MQNAKAPDSAGAKAQSCWAEGSDPGLCPHGVKV